MGCIAKAVETHMVFDGFLHSWVSWNVWLGISRAALGDVGSRRIASEGSWGHVVTVWCFGGV